MKRTLLYLLLLPALLSGTCLLAAGPAGNAGHGAKPCLRRLTCEGLTDPLAIDTATPRFGWQLRSGRRGDAQRSYRIEVASDSLRLLAEQTYDQMLAAEQAMVGWGLNKGESNVT